MASLAVWLVRLSATPARRTAWTWRAALVVGLWLAGHAALAASGLLSLETVPPPALAYLAITLGLGAWVAASAVGKRLATLPMAALVGLMAFRVPLELILHALYDAGLVPVQMTWSGLNFDVVTGLSAALLALFLWRRPVSDAVVTAWNVAGSALLVTVVAIAVLSAPLPIRQFHEGPPLVLVFHAPYNWIVNVHVLTALVGHLVIFRKLAWQRRDGRT